MTHVIESKELDATLCRSAFCLVLLSFRPFFPGSALSNPSITCGRKNQIDADNLLPVNLRGAIAESA